jgi:hypothetical protein
MKQRSASRNKVSHERARMVARGSSTRNMLCHRAQPVRRLAAEVCWRMRRV